jgi:hypothetical protein
VQHGEKIRKRSGRQKRKRQEGKRKFEGAKLNQKMRRRAGKRRAKELGGRKAENQRANVKSNVVRT